MGKNDFVQNFDYISADITDYISENNIFDIVEVKEIKQFLKNAILTSDDYITSPKQSYPTLQAYKFYALSRDAAVSVKNLEMAISVLNTIKKYKK